MIVYLSLGSNLGDRVGHLQQALRLLTDHQKIKLLSASSFYETEPVEDPDQDWFVNVAVAIDTDLSPDALLSVCLEIEQRLGRHRDEQRRYGPRNIDLDILLYGSLTLQQDHLRLPHPKFHQRAYVLVPLLEIHPGLMHPVLQKTVEQLHDELDAPEEVFLFGTRAAPQGDR